MIFNSFCFHLQFCNVIRRGVCMKFHKVLLTAEENFRDPLLSESCIPYKKWKKVAKKKLIVWDNIQHLELQCLQVDRILRNKMEPIYSPHKSISITQIYQKFCCANKYAENTPYRYKSLDDKYLEDLKNYAEINAQAVYKVCKKMEKAGFEGSMKFLDYLRSTHKYMFLGNGMMTMLKLEIDHHFQKYPSMDMELSCIVCFENITRDRPAIIFGCGHFHCFECFEKITGIKELQGTLYNRLAYVGNNHTCPVCRYPTAKYTYYRDSYVFWPTSPRLISGGCKKPI